MEPRRFELLTPTMPLWCRVHISLLLLGFCVFCFSLVRIWCEFFPWCELFPLDFRKTLCRIPTMRSMILVLLLAFAATCFCAERPNSTNTFSTTNSNGQIVRRAVKGVSILNRSGKTSSPGGTVDSKLPPAVPPVAPAVAAPVTPTVAAPARQGGTNTLPIGYYRVNLRQPTTRSFSTP